MNLFILSLIQKEVAEYMMDKHVSKILLEAVQMLCSAKRVLNPDDENDNKSEEIIVSKIDDTKDKKDEITVDPISEPSLKEHLSPLDVKSFTAPSGSN